jgi:hypothetical protein
LGPNPASQCVEELKGVGIRVLLAGSRSAKRGKSEETTREREGDGES